jgi:hypothetical protein
VQFEPSARYPAHIHIRAPAELPRALEAAARKHGTTVPAYVRAVLRHHLEREGLRVGPDDVEARA